MLASRNGSMVRARSSSFATASEQQCPARDPSAKRLTQRRRRDPLPGCARRASSSRRRAGRGRGHERGRHARKNNRSSASSSFGPAACPRNVTPPRMPPYRTTVSTMARNCGSSSTASSTGKIATPCSAMRSLPLLAHLPANTGHEIAACSPSRVGDGCGSRRCRGRRRSAARNPSGCARRWRPSAPPVRGAPPRGRPYGHRPGSRAANRPDPLSIWVWTSTKRGNTIPPRRSITGRSAVAGSVEAAPRAAIRPPSTTMSHAARRSLGGMIGEVGREIDRYVRIGNPVGRSRRHGHEGRRARADRTMRIDGLWQYRTFIGTLRKAQSARRRLAKCDR